MSVPAVLNALFQIPNLLFAKSSANKFKQEFQQLGQDLQSGNLSQAQSDLAAIQSSNNIPAVSSPSSSPSSSSQNSLEQLFSQLGQALHSGNLSTAQSADASLQQEFAQLGAALTNSTTSTSSASSSAINVTA